MMHVVNGVSYKLLKSIADNPDLGCLIGKEQEELRAVVAEFEESISARVTTVPRPEKIKTASQLPDLPSYGSISRPTEEDYHA